MMIEHQIRGIITVSILLAFISFIGFLTQSQLDSKGPVLSKFNSKSITVEVVAENEMSGIYFVEPGTTVRQMIARLAIKEKTAEDFKLQNGMKIRFVPKQDTSEIVIEKIEASKRLALGLPVDINLAGTDDLMLIPGVGKTLAANIVDRREKKGRYETIDQLTEIKGIKENKLSKLRQYLYVDQLNK